MRSPSSSSARRSCVSRPRKPGARAWAAASAALLLFGLAACGDDPARPGFGGTSSGGRGGERPQGDAGAGAEPRNGGGAAGTASRGGGPSAEAGAGSEAGAAGDAGAAGAIEEPSPIDEPCRGDRAFKVVAGAFVEPTSEALALELNRLVYGESPLTIVLRTSGDEPRVAASYTKRDGSTEAFPEALAPELAPGWIATGGFGTLSAQTSGWMLVTLGSEPLEIPLQNISFVITTRDRCTRGTAMLSAVIPGDNADLVDRILGTPEDPEEEEEERLPTTNEVPLEAVFVVELTDFNFESSP